MKIKSLSFSGLGGYRDKVEIDFTNIGLLLLDGKTGSGKSSILDTISWVLFDNTLRGIKKSDWLNTHCKTGIGTLILTENNKEITIERKRTDDGNCFLSILEDGKDISERTIIETQDKIEKQILGFSFEVFRNSIMFGQNDLLVLTYGTDKDRKQIIGEILGFQEIDICLDKSRENFRILKEEIDSLSMFLTDKEERLKGFGNINVDIINNKKSELEVLSKKKEEVYSNLESLKTLYNSYNQYNRLKELEEILIEKNTSLSILKEEISKVNIEEINNKVNYLQSQLKEFQEKEVFLRSEQEKLKNDCTNIVKRINKIVSLGGTCPVCYRPLDDIQKNQICENLNLEKDDIEFSLNETIASFIACKESIEGISFELERILLQKETYESILQKYQMLDKEVNILTEEKQRLETFFSSQGIDISKINQLNKDELEKEVSNKQIEFNGLESSIKQLSIEIPLLESKLQEKSKLEEEVQLEKSKIKEKVSLSKHLQFLIDQFSLKGVRNRILDEVIPFINQEVNEYLSELFPFVKIFLSTEVQGKTVLKQELTFNIEDIYTGNIRDFKSWSGGEKMLLCLALRLALWKVLYCFRDKRLEALFLDEVFGCLDEEYKEKVLQFLKNLQKVLDIPIVVVEHLPDIKESFEQVICVEKTEKGGSTVGLTF